MGTESGLTEAAKSEIAEAIRIVREDRFEKYVRERSAKPVDPPKDPPKDPEKDPVFDPPKDPNPTPPPVKDPPKDPDPKPDGRRSAYWGEIFD